MKQIIISIILKKMKKNIIHAIILYLNVKNALEKIIVQNAMTIFILLEMIEKNV